MTNPLSSNYISPLLTPPSDTSTTSSSAVSSLFSTTPWYSQLPLLNTLPPSSDAFVMPSYSFPSSSSWSAGYSSSNPLFSEEISSSSSTTPPPAFSMETSEGKTASVANFSLHGKQKEKDYEPVFTPNWPTSPLFPSSSISYSSSSSSSSSSPLKKPNYHNMSKDEVFALLMASWQKQAEDEINALAGAVGKLAVTESPSCNTQKTEQKNWGEVFPK